MDQQREKFLNLKTIPARLNAEETAWYLGFAPHDIPVLVARGLLKPLGHPSDNTVKFFAFTILDQLRSDPKWLARASDEMIEYWRKKNARKTKYSERSLPTSETAEPVVAMTE
jgi:hypothetical protein